ncbi:RES domain-containing protein [Amycolatopsis sp. cmx-4-54]|uniref:RES domain-containing protein n=1 Tax=Amycolatopsis sp. cmx-4-54 TaxID=2790936 RepID=UPI003978E633
MGTDYHSALEEFEAMQDSLKRPDTAVCVLCILDTALWRRVGSDAVHGTCSFCNQENTCTTFDELADVVDSVVNEWYTTVSESGAYHDDGELNVTTHDINDVAYDILNEAIQPDAHAVLSDYVASRDSTDYGWVQNADIWATIYDFTKGAWKNLSRDLKDGDESKDLRTVATLSSETTGLLAEIRDVALLQGLFKVSSPALWRCRSREGLTFPLIAKQLGSPPSGAANRMTTEGQSVFYGSVGLECAVKEISQGRDISFAAGKFVPSRELYYFDVYATPERPSVFEIDSHDRIQALDFLDSFSKTLSEPRTDDSPRHYIPSQVFIKFLRENSETPQPEAIRFKSSLDPDGNDENWVVFVDREHCVDHPAEDSDLHLILDSASTQEHPSSRTFLSQAPSTPST